MWQELMMMNNYLCSMLLACPARLYPICLRSEALRASLCSVRRTRGRLTVVHQRIVLRECYFEQSAKIIVRALPLTSNALPSLMKYSQWCRDSSPRNYNGWHVYIWPYRNVKFTNNFGWATPNCWHKILSFIILNISLQVLGRLLGGMAGQTLIHSAHEYV